MKKMKCMYTKYECRFAKYTDVWTIRYMELVDFQKLLDTKAFKQFVWEATCWCTFETPKKDATHRSSNNFSSSGQCNLQLSVGLWPLRELFILLALGQKKCNARYWKGWGLSAKLGKHCAIWGKLGTALQAYAVNPCTKFPPNPTSRKVNT